MRNEQECIKSDVALSCFVRALLRGLLGRGTEPLPHESLVKDFNSIVANGLNAETRHLDGRSARQVCQRLLGIVRENASSEEQQYLPIVQKRIECGNLSETIRERLQKKTKRMDLREAVVDIYSDLTKSLIDNTPYL